MDGEYSAPELDKLTVAPVNDLRACVWEIGLYFKPEIHKYFGTISANFSIINGKLIEIYSRRKTFGNPIKAEVEFLNIAEPKYHENNAQIEAIYKHIHDLFK